MNNLRKRQWHLQNQFHEDDLEYKPKILTATGSPEKDADNFLVYMVTFLSLTEEYEVND